MDLEGNTTAAAAVKTPDADEIESSTPTRVQHAKPLSFSSNGVLKRHNPLHHHRSFGKSHHAVVVTYKECLKNHAASLGGHAVDGCGEFMPSPSAASANPTLLKCAACGCHRNFHRREPEEAIPAAVPKPKPPIEFQSQNRHQPPPPPNHDGSGGHSTPNSPSPPPISSAYYPSSAPNMLLALSTGFPGPTMDNNHNHNQISAAQIPTSAMITNPSGRKRFRTKFTQDQKDKMLEFAEKVGWRFQKRDEDAINEFCSEIGVERGVLKVWMHNNKNNFSKRDNQQPNTAPIPAAAANGTDFHIAIRNSHSLDSHTATQFNLHEESSNDSQNHHQPLRNGDNAAAAAAAVNGSSSSS